MYCSKCGRSMTQTQAFCPSCGRAPGKALDQGAAQIQEQQQFDQSILRLSRFWYLFAALNIVLGLAGWAMFDLHITNFAGPWEPWPHPPGWDWTLQASVTWTLFFSRVVASLLAGWGLREHTEWGRPVALLAAAVALLQFPIGVVLGIYTFALLVGRQHSALYEHRVGVK
jgi:hypothetical protein